MVISCAARRERGAQVGVGGDTAPPAFPIYVGDMLVITVIAATKSVRKADGEGGGSQSVATHLQRALMRRK